MNTPYDYYLPKWEDAGKVHDWRNYVSDDVRMLWHTFTKEQRAALARQAAIQADLEEWD